MSTPTLIIGLGGVGLTIVRRICEDLATDKQKKSLSFAVFDTDANELREIENAKLGIHTIQISNSLTVGEYLQQDKNALENWFPVNQVLNSKLMTDGAGQVRAVSRLAFNTALVQGKLAPLDDAIGELYRLSGEKLEQAPRIIITGSLCGGTGSGLALPLSLYTRNYLETRVQHGASIVRGFFMLPETLFSVIEGESERDNLRSNAYAALREIDAFMMKADGNLPKEYDLHFTIPRVNAREEDEYTGRPMDFCFLFDGQNMNGQHLADKEEYLQHAANCIYSMAIAPTSSRSNSSEDNVIRDILAQKGRNRYAGAGTSMLVYPVKDVKRYLALKWTDEIISKEWVTIDRAYGAEQENNRLRRDAGAPRVQLDRGKHYTDMVNNLKDQNDPFSREIWRVCTHFSDPNEIVAGESKAESYLAALQKYVDSQVKVEKEHFKSITDQLAQYAEKAKTESGGDLTSTIKRWANTMDGWVTATDQGIIHCSQMIDYTLFKDPSDFTKKNNSEYRPEHWIGEGNKYIHPNAIRYFIYEVIQKLEAARTNESDNVRNYRKGLEEKHAGLFDVKGTKGVENKEEYIDANKLDKDKNLFTKGRIEDSVSEITKRMNGLSNELDDLWTSNTRSLVYEGALEYFRELARSFEVFYDVIDRYGKSILEEIGSLEKKYPYDENKPESNKPVRNVCADKDCLRAMGEEIVNKNNTMDLPGELNRRIYADLRGVAMQNLRAKKREDAAKEKENREITSTTNQFCISIFNETIVNYMASQIEDEYDNKINMDVLSALRQEARYRKHGVEMTETDLANYVENYMIDTIESTERLASPFIETPRYKQNRTIKACTYNPGLANPAVHESGRVDFIREHLPNGVISEDIDPTMILFYQAVYAIEAADLGKFAPLEKTSTTDKSAGDYYKAYHSLISKLHPDTQTSRRITPHIDRWWHLVTRLPELSDQAQLNQKKDIMRSLIWSLLGQYVKFYSEKKTSGRSFYKRSGYKIYIEGDTDTKLIVSNGTTCDRLYEVQDALTVYPELIDAILKRVNEEIRRDTDNGNNTAIEETFLYQNLAEFRLQEYPLKKTVTKEDGKTVTKMDSVRSIFELPLLIKRSVPARLYNAGDMTLLIDTILEELYNYHVTMFEKDDPANMINAFDKLLLDQFRLMRENISIEAATAKEEAAKKGVTLNGDIETDILNDDIMERIVKEIYDHGYRKDAREIEKARSTPEEE